MLAALKYGRPVGDHLLRLGCQCKILVVSDDWTAVNFGPWKRTQTALLLVDFLYSMLKSATDSSSSVV